MRGQGYAVELTATTGDYGADLILTKDRQRIAVQAKRYRGSVGVQAVQEGLSGQAYYRCEVVFSFCARMDKTILALVIVQPAKCGVRRLVAALPKLTHRGE